MQKKDIRINKQRKFLWLWVLFLFFIVPMTGIADTAANKQTNVTRETREYKPGCGHLRGFIFKPDGKTPRWGAQVVVQHEKTRQVFRSNVTDKTGNYEVLNIPAGNYVILILTRNKSYNVKRVDFYVKIISGKTSTISFSLKKGPKGLLYYILEPCCLVPLLDFIPEPEQSPTQPPRRR